MLKIRHVDIGVLIIKKKNSRQKAILIFLVILTKNISKQRQIYN